MRRYMRDMRGLEMCVWMEERQRPGFTAFTKTGGADAEILGSLEGDGGREEMCAARARVKNMLRTVDVDV